jgi:hypothetical protein
MIVWLNPMALAGIGVAAVPILIHLLRQHRAERIPFPSVRFIHPSRTAAVRLRRVQDPWLLLVRVAILAAAACALAQPVMLTPARLAAWNAKVSRAVVVDTSGSMRLHGAEAAAREAATAEVHSASSAVRFDVTNLGDGLRQATVWLATAPPGRREVVIVSDFQADALRLLDLRNLPGGTGVRGVQVGRAAVGQAFTGMALLGRGSNSHHEIRLEPALTYAALATGSGGPEGLRLIAAAGQEEAVARLMRSVSSAGTPAPSAAEPIAVVVAGGRVPSPLGSIQAGWMRSIAVRLMSDRGLLAAAADMRSTLETTGEPWTVIVRDSAQRPLVRAASSGPALVIDVAAPAGSFLTASVIRGTLLARQGTQAFTEQEVVRMTADQIAAWTRPPGPVGREVAVQAGQSDARWCWLVALLLLAAETLMRRSPPSVEHEARADAA